MTPTINSSPMTWTGTAWELHGCIIYPRRFHSEWFVKVLDSVVAKGSCVSDGDAARAIESAIARIRADVERIGGSE